PCKGPPQLTQVISRSALDCGGASTRTISYFAPQLEQVNGADNGFNIGPRSPWLKQKRSAGWRDQLCIFMTVPISTWDKRKTTRRLGPLLWPRPRVAQNFGMNGLVRGPL